MLTETQRNEVKALLESQRDRLLSAAKHVKSFSRDRDKSRIGSDSIDESAAELVIGTHLVLADQDDKALTLVLRSLRSLENGSYGQCVDCEDEIAWPRLRAFPASSLCLECKQDREEVERQLLECE